MPIAGIDETPNRNSARPGESSSMPRKSNDSDGRRLVRRAGPRTRRQNAMMPIGTLIRKIQCQLAASISQPPRIGPQIGPSSIGTPSTAITRPMRCGPAARVMIVMPSGMSMPPPRPWSDAERDQRLDRPRRAAQHRAGDEQHQREHVEALGAEPVGRPAGQRDHRRQRQRVAGHRPRGDRVGGVEGRLEGRQRDADDGDVEDRHDRAEHDDAGDLQDGRRRACRRPRESRPLPLARTVSGVAMCVNDPSRAATAPNQYFNRTNRSVGNETVTERLRRGDESRQVG